MSPAVALVAVLLTTYLLVGAMDLGVGLLLPLIARARDRDAALRAASPPWRAAATGVMLTLALVAAALPAGLAPLHALWPPLLAMLVALVARCGLAAMRPHVLRQDLVDSAFGFASFAAATCQGLVLGWFVASLSAPPHAHHAGMSSTVSIWGLLCATAFVDFYATLGSGLLIWAGRDAVRVFGREVGHAAAILTAGALALSVPWALITGVALRAFAVGWTRVAPLAIFGAVALTLLAAFVLSAWGRRPVIPLSCAALSAVSCLTGAATLPWRFASAFPNGSIVETASYICLILLLGLPTLVVGASRHRAGSLISARVTHPVSSHAGRRTGSLANELHLS